MYGYVMHACLRQNNDYGQAMTAVMYYSVV